MTYRDLVEAVVRIRKWALPKGPFTAAERAKIRKWLLALEDRYKDRC